MRIPIIITLLIIFAFVTVLSDGKREKELHITSLEIKFDKTDAIFTVNYQFDRFSKTYLLLLGTKTLEPKVISIIPDGLDYTITKISPERATIIVKNISVLDKGYYLHYSRKFRYSIDTVYISDPSNPKIKEFNNINSTPNYFYR